jgi:5'-3' exonuclease
MGLRTPKSKPKKTKTLIVDGNVLMKRSYNGAKNVYHKDKHIGGIFAFYSTLRKLISEHKIDKTVITWDGERGGTLRLDYYPEYKENRPRFFDQDYEIQKLRVKQYAEDLFIRQYEHPDVESDDLIAFYCQNRKKMEEVMVYTNDRDLCQLINENVTIFLADKKMEVGIGNYQWFFEHHYSNAGLIKIIEGCKSDNVKGIDGVTENTLLTHFPQLKERNVTLEEIFESSRLIQEERTTPLKALDNILNGVSRGVHRGPFYEINKKIIDLNNPLLPEEARESIKNLVELPLDPEGRDYKNVLKMMIEDGVMYAIPGGENGYLNFMEPFINLLKKEKLNFKNQKNEKI